MQDRRDGLLSNTPANPGEAGDEVDAIALLQLHQPLHRDASISSQLLFSLEQRTMIGHLVARNIRLHKRL